MEKARTIKVMIVEDHQIVNEGLAALLNDQPDMTVVGRAHSAAESLAMAARQAPDVVLMDFRLPDGNGGEVGVHIRDLHPEVKLVFLSRDDSDSALLAAVEAGASAFIHKSQAATEVVGAIRTVAGGATLITPRAIASLLNRSRQLNGLVQSLTTRERDVLRLVAAGVASRDIANRLGISYTTVRTHIRSLGRKLNVHSKIEASAKARELGLVD